jgi:hypothetical protein
MNPNYDPIRNTGRLADAAYWYYNDRVQIKALSDEKLKEEFRNLKKAARAFADGRVPWTDEIFWGFSAFIDELRARDIDHRVL